MGEVTYEQSSRAGKIFSGLPVYGVDSKIGLTSVPKYAAEKLDKYKVIEPGMFAYNPMRLNIGSIGLCKYSYVNGLVSPDYVVFGCDTESLLSEFLDYAIQGLEWRQWTSAAGVGSVRQRIYYKELARLSMTIPPISAQKNIVKILSALDDKIELNRQINQTLEQIAQAIFKSWFVDFEPVKAKIEAKAAGCDPERAAMCAISGKTDAELVQLPAEQRQQLSATAALFPDELEKSELGLIPQGWERLSLADSVQLSGGGTPKRSKAEFWGADIPWFSVQDAPADGDIFIVDTKEKITTLGLEKSSSKLLPVGTTIISARGTVGRLALTGIEMAMNQSCYGVRGIDGIGPYFNYFNLMESVTTLKQNTHGAVFDTITRQTFETVSCVKPTQPLLVAFEETVAPLMATMRSNLFERMSLADLRDTLLPKLLSGEVSVGECKQQVGE